MKVFTRQIVSLMWARGMPTEGDKFANIFRAAVAAGLTSDQAFALTVEAYRAAKGYVEELLVTDTRGSALCQATRRANAERFPNGKDAEDLRAEREGRPSRWGTHEFHHGAACGCGLPVEVQS